MNTENILFRLEENVAIIEINRPEERNALNEKLMRSLSETLKEVDRDDRVNVAIITGVKSAFCAGGDLKEFASSESGLSFKQSEEIREYFRTRVHLLFKTLYDMETPMIAAVNGAAYGAGLGLACGCDIRIAESSATFSETFVKIGLAPGDGDAWLIPRLIGWERYSHMAFTARILTAEDALQFGLISSIVDDGQGLASSLELAGQIAVHPRFALRMTKRLGKASVNDSFDRHLDAASNVMAICHRTPEHHVQLAEFMSRSRTRRS